MSTVKRALATVLLAAALTAAAPAIASAAPARLDPGDYVNCPIYFTDARVPVIDWGCFANTIHYGP